MTLQLHDTMSRELVSVEPIEPGHVRLYTCGPTVWNRVHIGNFRTFIFEDVLRRWLDRRFAVTHVMNLTDVDDRIIKNAVANGHTLAEETAPWIAAFEEDRDLHRSSASSFALDRSWASLATPYAPAVIATALKSGCNG